MCVGIDLVPSLCVVYQDTKLEYVVHKATLDVCLFYIVLCLISVSCVCVCVCNVSL
jgi:hypothetical protein